MLSNRNYRYGTTGKPGLLENSCNALEQTNTNHHIHQQQHKSKSFPSAKENVGHITTISPSYYADMKNMKKNMDRKTMGFEALVRPSEYFAQQHIELHHQGIADIKKLLDYYKVDEDPIKHWIDYIEHVKKKYVSDKECQRQALFVIYKRCVKALIHHDRYKNDQRFVRICVIYAARSGSSNNLDNFEYLYAMKVGISLAMLWMSWAWVAEKNRDYHLTDMIFRKALEKGAQPIHVVEERYDHFRQRMSRNVSDVTAAPLNMSTAMPIGRGVVPSNQCNKYQEKENRNLTNRAETNENMKRSSHRKHNRKNIRKNDHMRSNEKNNQSAYISPDPTQQTRPKRQKTRWVPPKLTDISNSSPFAKKICVHHNTGHHDHDGRQQHEQSKCQHQHQQQRRKHNTEKKRRLRFSFDKKYVAEDSEGKETCFERERARRGMYNIYSRVCINRLSHNSHIEKVVKEDGISYRAVHTYDTEGALEMLSSGKNEHDMKKVHRNFSQPLPRSLVRVTKKANEAKVNGRKCKILYKLGSGTYGTVLLCEHLENRKNNKFALKVQQRDLGCLAWEFVILKRLKSRLVARGLKEFTSAFPTASSISLYSNGGALQMTAGSDSGINLLDLVNLYKGNVPELLAIHYTQRMLCHIDALHMDGKILHCDIKPDNWIICSHPEIMSDVMLIDFGRAKDLTLFSDDEPVAGFVGRVAADDLECVAMRDGCRWCFDIDCFGIGVCAHILLFGTYMDIVQVSKKTKWGLAKPLKRYWQTPLWRLLFDWAINENTRNIDDYSEHLRRVRISFEVHLSSRSRELEHLLNYQKSLLPRRKN